MMAGLLAPGSTPFTVALLVMLGLTAVEVLTLVFGASVNDAVDHFVLGDGASHGLDATAPDGGDGLVGRFLAWLYVGRVPVLMILIVWLTVFGLGGLILQQLLRTLIGSAAPAWLAAPAVFVGSLPLLRVSVGALARVLPRDETSAVDPGSFIGLSATVVGGEARRGLAAQARLADRFGTDHYVLVEPEDDDRPLPNGAAVLIARDLGGGRFTAIPNTVGALDGASTPPG